MTQSVIYPDFLRRLDSDPQGAFADFYRFAMEQLDHMPPCPMRALGPDERKDLKHEIVYHCVKHDFRVLRRFRMQGNAFAGWLYVVSHRVAQGYLRAQSRRFRPDSEDARVEIPGVELAPLVQQVHEELYSLGDGCRRLLQLAAHGYEPRDIARALALPPGANKRISGQIAECRERLVKRLADKGVDILKWLGAAK